MSDTPAFIEPFELDDLTRELYAALRMIAHRERLRANRPQTMVTTALINESYVRLRQSKGWISREHFLASAATAMRHALIDNARARLSLKRGAGQVSVPLDHAPEAAALDDDQVVRLGEALQTLRRLDERLVKVVECRFFAGYSEAETAQVLGVSERTVRRDWVQAKAWLYREMQTKQD
jgi:RNA polymerase sigma factor (TIGR02999 family)